MDGLSVLDILNALDDRKSLDIFCSIAGGRVERDALKNEEGLSKKQFNLRTRQLLKVGLVKRKKGRFSLTTLGAMVYNAEFIIENGITNYWKLKAIDSIQSWGKIREHERISPIKTILQWMDLNMTLTVSVSGLCSEDLPNR